MSAPNESSELGALGDPREDARAHMNVDQHFSLINPLKDSPLVREVWQDKYQYQNESWDDMCARVVKAIYAKEVEAARESSDPTAAGRVSYLQAITFQAMHLGLWMPAGRILAGAGTAKRVTLMNCFVNQTIKDDMVSITEALQNTMLTQQQGGGIGTDFSPIRPSKAKLFRTGATASGPGPFIDTFDSAGTTIRSAGDRRGAQMGTLICTHPFLPEFITAKHEKGRWTNFNVSVLVTDAFMSAVSEDEEWYLHHEAEPGFERSEELTSKDFIDDEGVKQFVYSIHRARDLWDQILRSTYEYAEPGVIFIDRVNDLNNLAYAENIQCTNPCVTGDTLILTDQGHLPIKWLVGKKVSIWNGEEWSEVEPYSTGINPLMELTFSNGQSVKCTPYHKWILADGRKVEAKDLKVTDKLLFAEMPIIHEGGASFDVDAYSQGFYCGDGTKNTTESNLYKHEESIRQRLVGKFWDRNCESQPGYRWHHGNMLPKDFVPVNGTQEYCINWLAGLLDADGCVSKKHSGNVLEISAKDRGFLQRIGLMLNRLGVNYRMWERKDAGLKNGSNGKAYMCESTASLMISWKGSHQLVKLGLKTERVDLSSFQKAPQGVAKVGHRVTSIKLLQEREETFCFTEPKRNMGVFNGVLGGNCGEQPLPPHGACNLGAINLSRLVLSPFTPDADFNWTLLKQVVALGVRFLDNVIDVSGYPLEQQAEEQRLKRRIGLGISGLADAMHMMGMRYGSPRSVRFAEDVAKTIAIEAYRASIDLAKEKGSFPILNPKEHAKRPFIKQLPADIQEGIREGYLRNGVLLTIAPTGTTTIAYGNGSAALEPVFAHEMTRNVRQADGSWKPYKERSYGAALYLAMNGLDDISELPAHMNVCADVAIHEHIKIQEVCQRWVDASISKTINLPEEITFEQFREVYSMAYVAGLKGCTTYRPSEVRGSILSVETDGHGKPQVANEGANAGQDEAPPKGTERPSIVDARTVKIRWPGLKSALYLTVGYVNGLPYEVFLNSKDQSAMEWMTSTTLLMSLTLRQGLPLEELADEFKQIHALEGGWVEGKYHPSLISYLGVKMRELCQAPPPGSTEPMTVTVHDTGDVSIKDPHNPTAEWTSSTPSSTSTPTSTPTKSSQCKECGSYNTVVVGGCPTCNDCGWSKCS